MDFAFTAEAGLAGLFLASFLSATLLPGGSEAVLAAVALAHPDQVAAALVLATAGNTLGGMVTWWMGRLLPEKVMRSGIHSDGGGDTAARCIAALRRHGAPLLVLAWAPIIGDALCAAAGWLRLSPLPCAAWMAAGKAARYLVVVAGVANV